MVDSDDAMVLGGRKVRYMLCSAWLLGGLCAAARVSFDLRKLVSCPILLSRVPDPLL